MKRIAIIAPLILAATLSARAAAKPATPPPAAKWYIAVAHATFYGPFRKETTAINFCMGSQDQKCKVYALTSPKTAAGGGGR